MRTSPDKTVNSEQQTAVPGESVSLAEDLHRHRKLDLAYFMEPGRCPLMVQRGARGAFELFLYLAHRFLERNGELVLADHETMCRACGLDPAGPHSRSALSRVLRSLRNTFGVIDYEPRQRRRPQIRLALPRRGSNILDPQHYIYFDEGWNQHRRAIFDALGPRAFSTEYMYWIAKYESAMARTKHRRSYWFFPLERIAKTYHISTLFAGNGLRGLVDLGIMRVVPGQYRLRAPNDEFGTANRYYFEGLAEVQQRQRRFEDLEGEHGKVFEIAKSLAMSLTNGRTVKNVQGLCELITTHGETKVQRAIGQVASLPPRSLRRRLAYVSAIVSDEARSASR